MLPRENQTNTTIELNTWTSYSSTNHTFVQDNLDSRSCNPYQIQRHQTDCCHSHNARCEQGQLKHAIAVEDQRFHTVLPTIYQSQNTFSLLLPAGEDRELTH